MNIYLFIIDCYTMIICIVLMQNDAKMEMLFPVDICFKYHALVVVYGDLYARVNLDLREMMMKAS